MSKKQQKQMIWIGAAVLAVIILIAVFSGSGSRSSTNSPVPIGLSEEQKYARFEAEVACRLAESIEDMEDSESFIQTTLQIVEEASDKYGYTLAEVEAKKNEYAGDAEFRERAMEYALEICPEIVNELQLESQLQ